MKFIKKIQNEAFKNTSHITTLQVNFGKLCNLTCNHCHVEASPKRTEIMSKKTMEDVLKAFKKHNFLLLDITGGAPEMNEHFVWFIEEARKLTQKIIVRTNLVIMDEKEYEHLPEFYAKNRITLIASLPCYTKDNVDKMRGNGTFENSIKIIKKLNALGYGKDKKLVLNFVYNPSGAFLPGKQSELEIDYKKVLADNFGIVFNHLFTITNSPIGRFLENLKKAGKAESYMGLLKENFNAKTLENMMCRTQISVGFDGKIYDCDFNQMIEMPINGISTIEELAHSENIARMIRFDEHCYACTAGAGSSCCGVTLN